MVKALLIALFAAACARKPVPVAELPSQRAGSPPAAVLSLRPDAGAPELEAALRMVEPNEENWSELVQELTATQNRLLAWQAVINAARPRERWLSLDRPLVGFPIEAPKTYNAESITESYRAELGKLNPEMRAVLANPLAALPAEPGTPDEEFRARAVALMGVYDTAVRWELLSPYLAYFKHAAAYDLRGFYFLGRRDGLEEKFARWKELPEEERAELDGWLYGLCRNMYDEMEPAFCRDRIRKDAEEGKLWASYLDWRKMGQLYWNSLFDLQKPRADVTWYRQVGGMNGPAIPFARPVKSGLAEQAKKLLESGWAGEGWRLRLDYTEAAGEGTAHLRFVPGASPHTDKVGGSEITMDENVPLEQNMTALVFQHEFGHVLGFPDCYQEFFDEDAQKFVNFQLDLGNVMCSVTGKVTDFHREQLRNAYAREPRKPSSSVPAKKKRSP